MNDEIKEFIEFRSDEDGAYFYYIDKNGDEQWSYNLDNLKDYITNLQKENEDNLKCIKSLKEQLESVINENQRLLKQWFEDNDKTVKLISEKECYKQNFNDYKSRIEKAVEYINKNKKVVSKYEAKDTRLPLDTFMWGVDNLLNILQNGSDEK